MQPYAPSAVNTYSTAAGAVNLMHPLGSYPASLQAQQQQYMQQQQQQVM
jgi:hypothetical protein